MGISSSANLVYGIDLGEGDSLQAQFDSARDAAIEDGLVTEDEEYEIADWLEQVVGGIPGVRLVQHNTPDVQMWAICAEVSHTTARPGSPAKIILYAESKGWDELLKTATQDLGLEECKPGWLLFAWLST